MIPLLLLLDDEVDDDEVDDDEADVVVIYQIGY